MNPDNLKPLRRRLTPAMRDRRIAKIVDRTYHAGHREAARHARVRAIWHDMPVFDKVACASTQHRRPLLPGAGIDPGVLRGLPRMQPTGRPSKYRRS